METTSENSKKKSYTQITWETISRFLIVGGLVAFLGIGINFFVFGLALFKDTTQDQAIESVSLGTVFLCFYMYVGYMYGIRTGFKHLYNCALKKALIQPLAENIADEIWKNKEKGESRIWESTHSLEGKLLTSIYKSLATAPESFVKIVKFLLSKLSIMAQFMNLIESFSASMQSKEELELQLYQKLDKTFYSRINGLIPNWINWLIGLNILFLTGYIYLLMST